MGENIEEKLKKLKEIEAEELAELKQKRMLEAEAVKKENERKATEKLLAKLRKEKEILQRDLDDIIKKNFSLQLEYDSWDHVKQKKSEDLKIAEKILNEKHEKIWRERELFCDETDKYLEEYGISSKWWKERMSIINDPQQFDRYYLSRNVERKNIKKNQAVATELRKEIKILKDKIEQEEAEKIKNENLLKELESEKENLANEVKGPRYNSMIENIETVKKHCHELTKLIAEKETDLKVLENSVPVKNETQNMKFQPIIENLKENEKQNASCDSSVASTTFTSRFFQDSPVHFDELEMEVSPKTEIKQPESFLYEMLDPSSIRAAQAKAKAKTKSKSKPRSLSTMTPQERIRKLQIGFHDFLSEARK